MQRTHRLLLLAFAAVGIAVIGAALLILGNRSQAGDALMETANTLYAQERYAEAAAVYEQIAADQRVSADLYFNLGNAYYLQGDLGRSVLNYERAARLAPRDADIRANLATARSLVDGQIAGATPYDDPVQTVAGLATASLTSDELALAFLLLWIGFAALLFVYRARLTRLKGVIVVVGVALVAIAGVFAAERYTASTVEPGIIVAQAIPISTGPGAQFETTFNLYAGAGVHIDDTRGDWARVSLPGTDANGWIPTSAVAPIVAHNHLLGANS